MEKFVIIQSISESGMARIAQENMMVARPTFFQMNNRTIGKYMALPEKKEMRSPPTSVRK